MRYRSKPVEVEAMQWTDDGSDDFRGLADLAAQIVAWVNANGGEARYERSDYDAIPSVHDHGPRIAVRTINGWAYAKPRHFVVMGESYWDPDDRPLPPTKQLCDFYPVDPATFEQRWEPVAPAGSGEQQ